MRQSKRPNIHIQAAGRPALLAAIGALVIFAARSACVAADEPTKVSSRTVSDKAGAAPETSEHPLVGFIKMARSSAESIFAVRDYDAIFSKSELVGRKVFVDQMQIKFRKDPFSVYLRFLGRAHGGREVLYVDGKNQGNLLAHEGGGIAAWAGTMAIKPTSPRVMEEGRHPITEIGIQKMAEGLIGQWEAELTAGYVEKDPNYYHFYPSQRVDDLECKVLESTHAQPRAGFIFQTSRLYIDKKTNFPVRVEQWGFPPPNGQPVLIEEYTYTKIRPNVGLSNLDFDTRNRRYHF